MKTCPNCAEIVDLNELICRFCGKDIPPTEQEIPNEITDPISPDPEIDYAALLHEETDKNKLPSSPMKWIKTVFIVIFIIYSFITAIDRQIFSGTLFTTGLNRINPEYRSGLSIVEARFVKKVDDQIQVCDDNLKEAAPLLFKMSEDTDLFYEQSWQEDILGALENIKISCAALDEITPVPPRFSTAYKYMVSSSNEFDIFVQYMVQGIKELDTANFRLANPHLKVGAEYKFQFMNEIKSILNQ